MPLLGITDVVRNPLFVVTLFVCYFVCYFVTGQMWHFQTLVGYFQHGFFCCCCFCFGGFVCFVMATPGCSVNAAKNEKNIVPTVIRKNPPKLKNSIRITY